MLGSLKTALAVKSIMASPGKQLLHLNSFRQILHLVTTKCDFVQYPSKDHWCIQPLTRWICIDLNRQLLIAKSGIIEI